MNKKVNKNIEIETERKYFSTPGTSPFQIQKQVEDYDLFGITSESYQKSSAKIIVRKYAIK